MLTGPNVVALTSLLLASSVLPQTAPLYLDRQEQPAGLRNPISLDQLKPNVSATIDFSRQLALVPEAFKLAADAGDDARSVQRAINTVCAGGGGQLRLLARHYSMRSPVVQPCLVHWIGQGWQEQPTGVDLTGASLSGTWLDFTAGAFGSTGGTNPITISGVAAAGSIIERLGVSQTVALPAVGDTIWTPPSTPFLLQAENVNGGVEFRDIMCRGVDKCIGAHVSGRTSFRDIRGQAWRVLVKIDKSYDASRLDEIHAWPYYSTDNRVLAFQQANAAVVLSQRSDTPLFGRVFAFGVNAGLAFDASANEGSLAGGTTTGATVDSLSCDFVRHCLLGTPGAYGVQVQVGQLRSFGQQWGKTDAQVAARDGMLTGSDVIALLGPSAFIQVGNLENYGTDDTTVRMSSPTPSTVQIGALYAILTRMSANSTLVVMTGGAHTVTLSMPPALTTDQPSGWTLANGNSPGTLSWPTVTKRN